MKTFSYFAYGSNICTMQISERCPDSVKIGVATLHGYEFMINELGVAGVIERSDSSVIGILWQISEEDKESLDFWEGADVTGGAYHHKKLAVITDGKSVDALVYIARNTVRGQPREGYLEKIVDAALGHGFDHDYVRYLENFRSR
jgi:gamma-glutamylcyclotransferase (GGCT)/AIG2-like uncharacterized protein YtfP